MPGFNYHNQAPMPVFNHTGNTVIGGNTNKRAMLTRSCNVGISLMAIVKHIAGQTTQTPSGGFLAQSDNFVYYFVCGYIVLYGLFMAFQ